MATQIQRRRGTTAQHSTFTGALGELTVDTDKKTVVVHDGITAGGFPLAVASKYATLASPALTGVPTAPTAAAGTNTTQLATTAYAMTAAENVAAGLANAVAGVATKFASSAENAAGNVENKAVDPLGIREAFNATGSAPVFACRAWVNFNGTGTVAIRASGNVSSITDNGVGNYTVNFTTAMPDENYSTVATSTVTISGADRAIETLATLGASTTGVRVLHFAPTNGSLQDTPIFNVAVFR